MKFKILSLAFLGAALGLQAQQGYYDGVEYYRADQPEEAAIILNKTINDPGTNKAEAYYYLGQIQLKAGNTAEAKKNFEAGIAADPTNGYNYVGLGALDLKQGKKQTAETHFKNAKSLAKKDADLITEIARIYFNTDPVGFAKEIDKTIADAKKADKQSPAPYILEADMIAKEDVGKAAQYYDMAQNFDTDNTHPEAYVKYARKYFPVNPKFSIDKLKELLQKRPGSALAQRELAEKYYANNQLTMAAEQYGKYIQNPNHFAKDEQRYVGLLYFGKKYQESYDLARKLLSEDPDNIYMQRMQFLNKVALEQYADALAHADVFFANPKGGFVANDYTNYATALQGVGQDSLAIIQYNKALELAPDKADLYKDLSAAYSSAKKYNEAAAAFQKFIDKGDYSTNDLFMLARRYQNAAMSDTVPETKSGSINKGLEVIEVVMQRVPDNARIAQTRAILIFLKNNSEDTDEVYDAFKLVVDILDKNPENAKT
ncbi:MAG: tetratricopeptide repeat protein, partial [Muribaculaceae bacterium]|nr:tetratricopeptide repeat protein [Muribaculaceae bacterium]